tara:strand:- start:76 stop:981 length:906 start_codon:yes stop_codon:yes gene_type:complete
MDWLLLSLVSAGVTGIVGISDKTVIYKYAHSPMTLPLLIGMSQTTVGIVSLAISGIPTDVTLMTSLYALASGSLFGCAGIIGQRVLFTQEVSRTIPVTQSSPIFAALLALVILDESISAVQWGGIIAAVLGSALISADISRGIRGMFLKRSFYLLMVSAFLFGAANVIGKVALAELPLLYTHGLRMLALGLIFLSFAFRKDSWSDVKSYFSNRSPALLFVFINEFITAQLGLMTLLWALSLGPASLVSAVVGVRALFTVLYSTVIASIWTGALGEETSRGSIAIKLTSTLIIVLGIAAVAI